MTHTTIRSWPSIVSGVACSIGSACVMLWDVLRAGQLTIDHVLSVLVLGGTIVAGHEFFRFASWRRPLGTLGLALLFVVGTGYCVATTAGRTAESGAVKQAEAAAWNAGRKLLQSELDQAQYQLGLASAEVLRECRTGIGDKCKAFQGRERAYQALVSQHSEKLAALPAERPENAEARNFAGVLDTLWQADKKRTEAIYTILRPFIPALFLEIGAIVFLAVGFGRHTTIVEILPPARMTVDPVIAALRDGPLTNNELALKLGVRKGTASKLVTAREGQIKREKIGREVRISLAAPTMH